MTLLKRIKPNIAYLFLLVFFISLAVVGHLVVHDDVLLASPPPNALNEGWVLMLEDGTTMPLEALPLTHDVASNEPLQIQIVLPEAFETEQTLRVRTSLATIEVELKGESFYAHDFNDRMTIASLWHMIDLPAGLEGETLTLTFTSPYEAMSGRVNTIAYGTRVQLYEDLLETYGLRLLIAFVLFLIGLLMMLVAFLMRKHMHAAYACLGLFAVLLSVWLFAESRLMQFFTGNTFIIGALSYVVLPLIVFPLHGFFREVIVRKYRAVVSGFIIIHLLTAFFVYNGHAFGIRAFFETTIITLIAGTITMLGLLIVLMLEYKVHPSKNLRHALILYGIFLLFASFEFVLFIQQSFMQTSAAAFIGVMLGIIVVIFYFVQFILTRYRASLKKDLYEKLAFIDPLTDGPNRMAYIRDTFIAFEQAQQGIPIALVYFDLNNLKAINDDYGHHKGDAAIRALYDMVVESFTDLGACYRLGGDEFACLLEHADADTIERRKADFMHFAHSYNTQAAYPFSVAIGYAVYDSSRDRHIEDTMRRADKAMYKNKPYRRAADDV